MADEEQVVEDKKESGDAKKASNMPLVLGFVAAIIVGVLFGKYVLGIIPSGVDIKEEDPDKSQIEETKIDRSELYKNTVDIQFLDVMTNVKGAKGSFVKISISIWVDKNGKYAMDPDQVRVTDILQGEIKSELKSYSEAEIKDPYVEDKLIKGISERMDRQLREIYNESTELEIVKRVVIKDMVIQ